ncbi:metabotropic glutamate receptor 2, partial [Biomphalaria glabrata]
TLRSKLMALKNVCIATSQKIYQSFDYEDYVLVMKDLLEHKNARVVIAFTDPENIVNLLKASQKQGTGGYFLWLTNDVWKMSIDSINDKDLIKSLAGSLVVSFESLVSPDYNSHVKNMTPDNSHNPWFR